MHGVNFGFGFNFRNPLGDRDHDGIPNFRDPYNNLTGQFRGIFNRGFERFRGMMSGFGFRGWGPHRGPEGHHRGFEHRRGFEHHRGPIGARPGHYGNPGMGHGVGPRPHIPGAGRAIPIGRPCHR